MSQKIICCLLQTLTLIPVYVCNKIDNEFGQANPATNASIVQIPAIINVPPNIQIEHVYTNTYATFILTQSQELYGFGLCALLGTETKIEKCGFTKINIPGKIKLVATSSQPRIGVVTVDNRYFKWGVNITGIPDEIREYSFEPPLPDGVNIDDFSMGEQHEVFLGSNGLIYGTGYNFYVWFFFFWSALCCNNS